MAWSKLEGEITLNLPVCAHWENGKDTITPAWGYARLTQIISGYTLPTNLELLFKNPTD